MLQIIGKLVFFLKVIFLYLLTFILGLLVPKKKNLVVMAASKGGYYNGNAKALFEFLEKENDIDAYFFVSKRDLFNELSKEKDNIVYQYSWKGLWLFLRARTVCITHGHADVLGFCQLLWQNWIYLGHGSGIKVLGYLKERLSFRDHLELILGRRFIYIVPSDFSRYMFSARYKVNPRHIYVTGYPRTDTLYDISPEKASSRKKLLYAPTYKKDNITEFFPFGDGDMNCLHKLLEEYNLELLVRFHPNNYLESRKKIDNILKSSDRIVDASPDVVADPQDLLIETNILITDISSISRDYLFLNRPVIFVMNDLDKSQSKDFLLKEEFIFCGYQVRSFKELKRAIEEIIGGGDQYRELREFVRNFSFNYVDGNSSKRVAELIKKLA